MPRPTVAMAAAGEPNRRASALEHRRPVLGAFSTNAGQSFGSNIQISVGTSNAHDSGNGIDYGDYSGLSFVGGVAHPAWSDNSNRTGTNPDGTLHQLDIYTAAVPAS